MKTILIIDDEDLVVKSLEKILRKNGYHVLSTRSGLHSLEIIKSTEIDLLICDIRMPEITGIEILKKIREARVREQKSKIPEILITGYADDAATLAAQQLKVDEYLYKPFDVRVFLSAVKRIIGDPS